MPSLVRVIGIALTLSYPIAVYLGLQHLDARYMVLLLLLLAGLRLVDKSSSPLNHWLWLPLLAVLVVWTWLSNTPLGLKFYPVLVSASMLIFFLWSLKYPPSIIERIARLRTPDLPKEAVSYTAKVTKVWCCFFLANGSIAFITAVYGSNLVWVWYNGFLSYMLMGLLFAGEWLVRKKVMKAVRE